MAIHAHSTTAPAVQPRLLRSFTFRPTPPVDDPRGADELLEEIRRAIEGQEGVVPANGTLAADDSTARQPCEISNLLQKEALASTASQGLLPPALPSLSTTFSRRRAIFGAVALAAAPVAALPAAAGPLKSEDTPPRSTSHEAAALRAEFNRVSTEYATACREADEAVSRIAYDEAPEALYWRRGDIQRLGFRSPERRWENDRHWYGEDKLIEDLRAAPFRWMSGRRDDEGAGRRDEIVNAWDSWQASKRATEDACGHTAAEARFDTAHWRYEGFITRLVELRTSDLDVMILKAQVVFKTARGTKGLDRMVAAAQDADGVRQEAMAMSLVRDFIGAAYREVDL